jgi:hypothetical protein
MNATAAWPRIAGWLKRAAMAAAVGVAVSSFYAIANWPNGFAVTLFIGAVIGVVTFACIGIAHAIVRKPFARLPERVRIFAMAILFSVAGAIGAMLGLVTAVNLSGGHMRLGEVLGGRGTPFVIASSGIAVIAALLFRGFSRLQQRVRETAWAERELEMAREIQTRLLPAPRFDGDGFTLEARNLAANYVAGDFYDFVRNDDGSVVIVVADVAGKGMSASLIMASVKAVLPYVARGSVAATMRELNAKLVVELAKREFVAVLCARYDPRTRTLELANGGCPDPYLVRGASVEAIGVGGIRLPLGMRAGIEYETVTRTLAPHDRVLFLSDGMPEAPKPSGDPLGYDELARMIAATRGELDPLIAAVRAATTEKIADDWTSIALAVSSST